MANAETIPVEVVYALPDRQVILALEALADANIAEVIAQSGILQQFPEIDLDSRRSVSSASSAS